MFTTRRETLLRFVIALSSPLWLSIKHAFAARPVEAFQTEQLEPTYQSLFGTSEIQESSQIRVLAADLAENGAVVPVKVEVDLPEVRAITILASKNPVPLVAQFVFAENTEPFVATRIKLAESCDVIAVVETAQGLMQAKKSVEVTVGGCGA